MALLEHSDNLNPLTNVFGRPIMQTVNPNVEISTPKCRSELARLGNSNQRHSLPNGTPEQVGSGDGNGVVMASATNEHQCNRGSHAGGNAHDARRGAIQGLARFGAPYQSFGRRLGLGFLIIRRLSSGRLGLALPLPTPWRGSFTPV